MKRLYYIFAFLVLLCSNSAYSQPDSTTIDDLRARLTEAKYSADSIKILTDMFDMSVTPEKIALGNKLIPMASTSGNAALSYDIIRRMANFRSKDVPYLDSLLAATRRFPETTDRRITETFIRMLSNCETVRNASDSVKLSNLHRLIHEYSRNSPIGVYEKIIKLHYICLLLSDSFQSDIIDVYNDDLGKLIARLPDEAYSLRNLYWVQSAINYTRCGLTDKALLADRKLLDIINELEVKSKKEGRNHINYAPNRYIIYTRMLSNLNSLQPDEIENLYARVMKLVKTDSRAARTFQLRPEADVYYNMYHKNYDKASEAIRTILANNPTEAWKTRRMLKHLIECSTALGNKDELIWALTKYSAIDENFIQNQLADKYKELQIIYDIHSLKDEYFNLMKEKNDNEHQSRTTILIVAIVCAALLLVLVLVLLYLYRRTRSLAAKLRDSNELLTEERDKLEVQQQRAREARDQAIKSNTLRADFIKNLSTEIATPLQSIVEYSHLLTEIADESTKPFTENYASIIEYNCDYLRTISEDVVTLSEIDTSDIVIKNAPVNLAKLIPTVIESVKSGNKKVVDIKYTDEVKRPFLSDSQRIVRIVTALLQNAVKFSDGKNITVDSSITPQGEVQIAVTDTGVGILPIFKDKIFQRFFKINKDQPGIGFGLPIARSLAQKLGGNVTLDSTYTAGARFLFTLPLK
ncbi:MAG: HAMP domain-containing histidine kinase [Lachnoclostridium sp.]|nr:HAMP domain-containing histidine kinase [Lachnoclostridium sp.]